ncbi:hypothetical protein FE784_09630 [Paenibacillus hemerocallicola]|uniref:DUF2140 family protein n=1 Tax=Paenibacillus hemerocallicola TaxID=1172614 RepID=A0A5C4TDD4_9BACL|nr:hypothetical protein [Paenibacillus hemerocallicola]TNJ66517.1 hypothetical protein FE784_09630 [Paenibacillus hemerocallicola]
MIRKAMYVLAVLLLLLGAAGYAAIRYAKPTETLNLDYGQVSVLQKLLEMVKIRKPDVHISERELNDILKKQLADRAQLTPNVVIEGARFEQHADRLAAYVNLKTAGGVRIGATLDFALAWDAPELIVRHTGTRIRSWNVPASWLQLDPMVVKIDDGLPPLIAVRDIRFEEDGITVSLKLN